MSQRNKSRNRSSQTNGKKPDSKTESQSVRKEDEGKAQQQPESPTRETEDKNDPEWYARDPYLLRDAASYPFGYALGKDYALNTKWARCPVTAAANLDNNVRQHGIMTYHMKPSLGWSEVSTSPINVAAASIYAFVRHMNSGRKNYDQADLFLYLTSIANLYSAIIWAERLYSFTMTWADQNRYIGDALLRSNGVDPDNMRVNLANFRMWLNAFINKVSVWAIPNNITYLNKVCFMYRNVYLENMDGNIKDQMYMYVPDGFHSFALDDDTIGMLDYKIWNHGNITAAAGSVGNPATAVEVIQYLESLMAPLFSDEDASLISGDIFKVYGDNIIRLPSVDEFIALPLVYDPMILWQMKNTTPTTCIRLSTNEAGSSITVRGIRGNYKGSQMSMGSGRTTKLIPGNVYQDNAGLLISLERMIPVDTVETTYDVSGPMATLLETDKCLSSDVAHPEPGIIMESSRNIVTGINKPLMSDTDTKNPDYGWVQGGTYICQAAYAWMLTGNGLTHTQDAMFTPSTDVSRIKLQFKYAPISYQITVSGTTITHIEVNSDLNNFTILTEDNIKKLHDVALLSLFYVPGIAKVTSA